MYQVRQVSYGMSGKSQSDNNSTRRKKEPAGYGKTKRYDSLYRVRLLQLYMPGQHRAYRLHQNRQTAYRKTIQKDRLTLEVNFSIGKNLNVK